MTLPKEWLQEAENKAGDTLDNTTFEHNGDYQRALESAEYEYVNGATAYKQAVEKAVNERIVHLEDFIRTVKDMHLNGLITAAKTELLILLDTLQTLKPTSND